MPFGQHQDTPCLDADQKALGSGNEIAAETRLDGTTHEQTVVCRQLFADHVMDSRPMERNKKRIE